MSDCLAWCQLCDDAAELAQYHALGTGHGHGALLPVPAPLDADQLADLDAHPLAERKWGFSR